MALRLTRKQLLEAPVAAWDGRKGPFSSLAILSEGRAHDSGYAAITIVGIQGAKAIERCTTCSDDLCWNIEPGLHDKLRTDCLLPSRALHFWSNHGHFHVGSALSSIDVFFGPKHIT